MPSLINPGSGAIPASGQGWTNTHEGAVAEARRWHDRIEADGIRDVELLLPGLSIGEGRWAFGFRHKATRKVVELETHGLDDWRAHEKELVFSPRVYWNGSSSANPQVEDWAADGFEIVKSFRVARDA